MKTSSVKYEYIIEAPIEKIFPLVCPVKEYDWIKGWKCKLVHCPNGVNEEGVIFKEKLSAPFLMRNSNGMTTWTTILYDTVNYRIHFKLENEMATILYAIKLNPGNNGDTKVFLDFAYTPRNTNAENFMDERRERNLEFLISGLGTMMKVFAETGELYDSKGSERLNDFLKSLTFKEKRILIHNKIRMMMMKDGDRKKYLKGQQVSIIGKG